MKFLTTNQPKTFHDKLFLNYSCEDDEDCELTDGSGDSVSQKEDKVVLSTGKNDFYSRTVLKKRKTFYSHYLCMGTYG